MSEDANSASGRKGRHHMNRRQFVRTIVSLGVLGTFASFLSLLMSILPTPRAGQEEGAVDNTFRYSTEKGAWYSEKSGTEVRVKDFDSVGKGAGVLWRGTIPAVLIRVDESKLRGANANNGLVAFATACTHLCCIATWHLDRPNEDVLFCRCHDGVFDPYDLVTGVMPNGAEYLGAKVIGGPPPRAMPMIPIEIKDGKVMGVPSNIEIYRYCE